MWQAGVIVACVGVMLEHAGFNALRCGLLSSAGWRLSAIVVSPAVAFLLLGAPRAAFAAALPQPLIIAWFNLVRCQGGELARESPFVAGLGAVFVLAFSLVSAAILGVIGFALDQRARRGVSSAAGRSRSRSAPG